MLTCLQQAASDLHMVQLMSLTPHHLLLHQIQAGLTFLKLANPGCPGGLTAQVGWLGLRVGGHPVLSMHSSNEPGELLQ